MAAATDVVINDGQSTPAAHTFSPSAKNNGKVIYEERTTNALPTGFYSLSVSQGDTKGSSPVIRQRVDFAFPIQVTDSTTGQITYPAVSRASLEVLVPKTATASNRADLYAYIKNFVAHTVVQNLVKNLDQPF